MKSKWNTELDHIRKLWSLRKGTNLILEGYNLIPVGYSHHIQQPYQNDNEAKP